LSGSAPLLPTSYSVWVVHGGDRDGYSRHLTPKEGGSWGQCGRDVIFQFRHGFTSAAVMSVRLFARVAGPLCATEPIEDVSLSGAFAEDGTSDGPWEKARRFYYWMPARLIRDAGCTHIWRPIYDLFDGLDVDRGSGGVGGITTRSPPTTP
jgi:hypothetical protein